jgi:SP family general alpha glucoside:H+ symporter-like MFS transporter
MANSQAMTPCFEPHTHTNDGILCAKDRRSNDATYVKKEQAEARAAFNSEKTMTVRQAIRLYRKAIIFSMAMSLAVVMEG